VVQLLHVELLLHLELELRQHHELQLQLQLDQQLRLTSRVPPGGCRPPAREEGRCVMAGSLRTELMALENETFEVLELVDVTEEMAAWSSCSTSSCCATSSCSCSSTTSCSCSSCG
jgi:hypothetical protein